MTATNEEKTNELAPVQFPRSGGKKAVLWLDRSQLISAAVLTLGFFALLFAGSSRVLPLWLVGLLLVVDLLAVAAVVTNVAERPLPW